MKMAALALAWIVLALALSWSHLATWKRWYEVGALVGLGLLYLGLSIDRRRNAHAAS